MRGKRLAGRISLYTAQGALALPTPALHSTQRGLKENKAPQSHALTPGHSRLPAEPLLAPQSGAGWLVGRATIWGRQLAPPTRLPPLRTPPPPHQLSLEQGSKLGGHPGLSQLDLSPCIPRPGPGLCSYRQPADGHMALESKSELCHLQAVPPRASVLPTLSLSLLIPKKGRLSHLSCGDQIKAASLTQGWALEKPIRSMIFRLMNSDEPS